MIVWRNESIPPGRQLADLEAPPAGPVEITRVLNRGGERTDIWFAPVPADLAGPAPVLKRIDELAAGDLVMMYGTVVQITGPWYRPPGEPMTPEWGRLPMVWEGMRCAPPEIGSQPVRLAP